MRLLILFLMSIMLCLAASINAQTRMGKDYALFFANDDYRANSSFDNLKNPVKDAYAIEKELREMYGFTTKVYTNKDQGSIFSILEQWQQRRFG